MVDEPSLGLSPVMIEELYGASASSNAAEGVTILLVEQYVDLALEAAGHAYVLGQGRIVLSGPARDLTDAP